MENTNQQMQSAAPAQQTTPQAVVPHPQFCDVEGHDSKCQCHVVRQLSLQADVRGENLRAQAVMGKLLAILKRENGELDPESLKSIRAEIATALSGTIAGDDDACDLCGKSRKQAPRCEQTYSQRHMYGIIREQYRNDSILLLDKINELLAKNKSLEVQLQKQTQQPQAQSQPQFNQPAPHVETAEGEEKMSENMLKMIERIGFEWGQAFLRGVSRVTPQPVEKIKIPKLPRNSVKMVKAKQEDVPRSKQCSVSGCTRKSAAKGLCHNHWSKAHRLEMNLDKLSASDLKTLAADGRKLRWQQKSVAKKTAAMRRSKK